MTVHELLIARELDYPRIDFSHRRNRHFSSLDLVAYVQGRLAELDARIYVRDRAKRLGAVRLASGLFAAPAVVADTMRSMGAKIIARPLIVNGTELLTVFAAQRIDALDLTRSEIDYVGPSQLPEVMKIAWSPVALTEPLFRTPQTYDTVWVSGDLPAAINSLGLPGLRCEPRGLPPLPP